MEFYQECKRQIKNEYATKDEYTEWLERELYKERALTHKLTEILKSNKANK